MKYMRLSVDWVTDDKIQQLTNDQQLLFIKLICWSVQHETDGRIPSSALPAIRRRHKYLQQALDRMVAVGLLHRDKEGIGKGSVRDKLGISYDILAFSKWQMVTTDKKVKPAGQGAGSDGPSHGRTGARTETKLDRRSYIEDVSSLAPAEGLKDPKLRSMLDRIGKKVGEMNGHAN